MLWQLHHILVSCESISWNDDSIPTESQKGVLQNIFQNAIISHEGNRVKQGSKKEMTCLIFCCFHFFPFAAGIFHIQKSHLNKTRGPFLFVPPIWPLGSSYNFCPKYFYNISARTIGRTSTFKSSRFCFTRYAPRTAIYNTYSNRKNEIVSQRIGNRQVLKDNCVDELLHNVSPYVNLQVSLCK